MYGVLNLHVAGSDHLAGVWLDVVLIIENKGGR